jgi:DNA-binding NarL/FixJ family response regulator
VLLVVDHALVRAGARMWLAREPGLTIVGEAPTITEVLVLTTRV